MTDVMTLLILLVVFRRPYAGEELYRVTDVMTLLRTSGRSTRKMHVGGMKFTAAFQLVRQKSFFRKINCKTYNSVCWNVGHAFPLK